VPGPSVRHWQEALGHRTIAVPQVVLCECFPDLIAGKLSAGFAELLVGMSFAPIGMSFAIDNSEWGYIVLNQNMRGE
jgi:hypothetical protein